MAGASEEVFRSGLDGVERNSSFFLFFSSPSVVSSVVFTFFFLLHIVCWLNAVPWPEGKGGAIALSCANDADGTISAHTIAYRVQETENRIDQRRRHSCSERAKSQAKRRKIYPWALAHGLCVYSVAWPHGPAWLHGSAEEANERYTHIAEI